ncbi:MAG: hypothetical protein ACREUJ_03595, partial [Burkholderiales bacterium]
ADLLNIILPQRAGDGRTGQCPKFCFHAANRFQQVGCGTISALPRLMAAKSDDAAYGANEISKRRQRDC